RYSLVEPVITALDALPQFRDLGTQPLLGRVKFEAKPIDRGRQLGRSSLQFLDRCLQLSECLIGVPSFNQPNSPAEVPEGGVDQPHSCDDVLSDRLGPIGGGLGARDSSSQFCGIGGAPSKLPTGRVRSRIGIPTAPNANRPVKTARAGNSRSD